MAAPWIDLRTLKKTLADFFDEQRQPITTFGSTVNQTFEAFVFASVIGWYRECGWDVVISNPLNEVTGKPVFKLKFSTRGRPADYSHATCSNGSVVVHVRHQLRVATRHHRDKQKNKANVCLDVAVIRPTDVSSYSTDTAAPNEQLISFGEAKHMSAFAELVAGFIGLVHEMQPERLKRTRIGSWNQQRVDHPAPFLYVSGVLYFTAEGIKETILRRRYDIDLYTQEDRLSGSPSLPASIR